MSLLNGELSRKKSPGNRNSSSSRIIAPNGSIISNFSNTKTSTKLAQSNSAASLHNSPKSGSIISKTHSESNAKRSKKGGSVASSVVSSQLARRKKKRDAETLATRSLSVNSLARRSNENIYGDLTKYQKSQSLVSLKIAEEIQILRLDERNMILAAIKKCKLLQKREDRRKQKLMTKINELKATRPPFPIVDPKNCYICFYQFWPIVSTKIRCCYCNTIVCKSCFQEHKMGKLCSHCKQELLYTTQLASVFARDSYNDHDSDDGLDLSTVERMIIQTSETEASRNNLIDIYDGGSAKSRQESESRRSNLIDKYDDGEKAKSKSGGSIFSGSHQFWNKKKKESLPPASIRSEQLHHEINGNDNRSHTSRPASIRSEQLYHEINGNDNRSHTSRPASNRSEQLYHEINENENRSHTSRMTAGHLSIPRDDAIYEDDHRSNTSRAASIEREAENNDDLKSVVSMAMSQTKFEDLDEDNALIDYGEIMIGLSYNYNKLEFRVIIKKCRDLHPVLKKERTSNPFVQVVLLPEISGEPVRKTKVKTSNLNPIYDEQCKFKNIPFDELVARSVMVTVIHRELAGKNIFLGQKIIELCTHSFENATAFWYRLEERCPVTMPPALSKYYGDIIFSLKYTNQSDQSDVQQLSKEDDSYFSASGSLKLWIKQANNLFSSRYNKLPDTFVSCSLVPKSPEFEEKVTKKKGSVRKKENKIKTPVIQKSLNPIWNADITFKNISKDDLRKKGLEITVWDKKMGLLKDVLLGGVSMNVFRKNKSIHRAEQEVWNKMLDKPEMWIEATLVLRTDI